MEAQSQTDFGPLPPLEHDYETNLMLVSEDPRGNSVLQEMSITGQITAALGAPNHYGTSVTRVNSFNNSLMDHTF